MAERNEMKERPILFSDPMVRAILENRKSQTRRIVKPQPFDIGPVGGTFAAAWNEKTAEAYEHFHCPYGQPGDRLWVRETWCAGEDDDGAYILYTADNTKNYSPIELSCSWNDEQLNLKWEEHEDFKQTLKRPSVFMPRWASRITLEITVVRVERLHDISEADVIAEGVVSGPFGEYGVAAYRSLWKSIHGPDSWAANPLGEAGCVKLL